MLIICTKCEHALELAKMGVWMVHYNSVRDVDQVYRGDLYECRECGFHIVADFGKGMTPQSMNGTTDFSRLVARILDSEHFKFGTIL